MVFRKLQTQFFFRSCKHNVFCCLPEVVLTTANLCYSIRILHKQVLKYYKNIKKFQNYFKICL